MQPCAVSSWHSGLGNFQETVQTMLSHAICQWLLLEGWSGFCMCDFIWNAALPTHMLTCIFNEHTICISARVLPDLLSVVSPLEPFGERKNLNKIKEPKLSSLKHKREVEEFWWAPSWCLSWELRRWSWDRKTEWFQYSPRPSQRQRAQQPAYVGRPLPSLESLTFSCRFSQMGWFNCSS